MVFKETGLVPLPTGCFRLRRRANRLHQHCLSTLLRDRTGVDAYAFDQPARIRDELVVLPQSCGIYKRLGCIPGLVDLAVTDDWSGRFPQQSGSLEALICADVPTGTVAGKVRGPLSCKPLHSMTRI